MRKLQAGLLAAALLGAGLPALADEAAQQTNTVVFHIEGMT